MALVAPPPVAWSLNWQSALFVAQIGSMRQIHNRFKKLEHKYGANPNGGWDLHIEGCGGEMSIAQYFRIFYDGSLGNFKVPDVGELQVRTTDKASNRLIVHPEELDTDPFILVTGLLPDYVIRGWCWGHEAKREDFWADPQGGRPAFFVPQNALRDIMTLEPYIRQWFASQSQCREVRN